MTLQGGGIWNGSAWIQTTTATPNSNHSTFTYNQPNHNSMAYQQYGSVQPLPVTSGQVAYSPPASYPVMATTGQVKSDSNMVEHYSRSYQYWKDQGDTRRREAAIMAAGPARNEALRTAAWSDYYASQSQYAAHYYNNKKNQLSTPPPPLITSNQALPPQTVAQTLPTKALPKEEVTVEEKKPLPVVSEKIDKYKTNNNSNSTSLSRLSNNSNRNSKKDEAVIKKKKRKNRFALEIDYSKRMALLHPDYDVKKKDDNNITPENNNEKNDERESNVSLKAISTRPDTIRSLQAGSEKKKSDFTVQDIKRSTNMFKKSIHDFLQDSPSNSPEISPISNESSISNNFFKKKMNNILSDPIPSNKSYDDTIHNDKRNVIVKTKKKYEPKKSNNGFESSKKILAKRASRFSGKGGLADSSSNFTSNVEPETKLGQYMGLTVIGGNMRDRVQTKSHSSYETSAAKELDYEAMTVRGVCQRLEKDFFRLTAPPQANLVRPEYILQKHLLNLKKRWSNSENDYTWLCSQLKAIRQDLTVQRIINPFAVEVYETHARIALEQGDLNEYNQCQTQLKDFYYILENEIYKHEIISDAMNIPGLQNENEFIAYRIIYYVFLTGNKKYEGGSSDLFNIMLSLTSTQKMDPCIIHALKVRVAVAENDYHSFFRLQDDCPNMGAYLMDYMVPPMRLSALKTICKAYRPSISIRFVLSDLGFDVELREDFILGLKWIRSCGGIVDDKESKLLTKQSLIRSSAPKQTNSLI